MQGTTRLRQEELRLRLLEDHIREQTNYKFSKLPMTAPVVVSRPVPSSGSMGP